MKLANSISQIVRGAYVPFVGVDADAVVAKVQKHFDVTRTDIELAIEVVLKKN
jgi:hypothetical protein